MDKNDPLEIQLSNTEIFNSHAVSQPKAIQALCCFILVLRLVTFNVLPIIVYHALLLE